MMPESIPPLPWDVLMETPAPGWVPPPSPVHPVPIPSVLIPVILAVGFLATRRKSK